MPRKFWRFDHLLCAVFLGTMALISFINILGRYCFHYSLSFTEEVTINLFVWVTVIGSGIAFERGCHLGMETLYSCFSRRWQRVVIVSGALINTLLFVVVDFFLVQTIYQEMTLFQAKSPSLGIPIWIYYAGVVVCSVFVFKGIYLGCLAQLERSR